MKKHFVTFLSPGSFVAEDTTKEIESWDIDKSIAMSKNIVQRYGSKPYGFYFITKERKENELDSKIVSKSNMYYLGGKIRTLEELKAENDHRNRILISNMECNSWDKIITNSNSYKWTQPLNENDIVLDIE